MVQLPYLSDIHSKDCRRPYWVRALVVVQCLLITSFATAEPSKSAAPSGPATAQIVGAYFASLPGFQAGDLIHRSQIEAVIELVEMGGVQVDKADELVERGLPDSAFLIRVLSSPAGKKFMRKIGRQRGAYGRLDRLSSIPGGEKRVRELVKTPGGDQLLEYLTTTKGGHKLGRQLANVRGGVDLNKPTGRIYTADDLLQALLIAEAAQ
jgi:hypothetical protein